MVIKRNSYYNTGRFHRKKKKKTPKNNEEWRYIWIGLSTLFETGLNILSWLAWNSQRSTSVRSLDLGPFCLWLLYFQEGWIFWDE